LLVPEAVTFFYAHDALRKMWGESPGNPIRQHRRDTDG